MAQKTLAIYGGSFNPPARFHRAAAMRLARNFDTIVIVPCGPRPDKPTVNDAAPIYRAAMADLTFGDVQNVRVDLFDLEASTFTRTHELERRYEKEGDVWHVIGAEYVAGGKDGRTPIQEEWECGRELWENAKFVVVHPCGAAPNVSDLPPHCRVIEIEENAPPDLRSFVFHGKSIADQVVSSVADYIARHGLYRGAQPRKQPCFSLQKARWRLFADENNPKATALAEELAPCSSEAGSVIVALGGDGTMLQAIRGYWRLRRPFYGVNTGHLGFLLNADSPQKYVGEDLHAVHARLLYAETESIDGEIRSALAFNDAWVERASGQTAWIRVRVNGQERLSHLISDGALVATAAGSTSYARAMGAPPLPVDTPALILAGSNVLSPISWRPSVLPLDSVIEFETLDPAKRPLQAYVDGQSHGLVKRMRVRTSNIASVELLFAPGYDPAAKLAKIQFPALDEKC